VQVLTERVVALDAKLNVAKPRRSFVMTLDKGDLVRCVRTYEGAKRKIGWEGKVTDVTHYEDGETCRYGVVWDDLPQKETYVYASDVEAVPTEECGMCHERKRLSDFDGDYLCYACRTGLGKKVSP
jgi:hypothetical protein